MIDNVFTPFIGLLGVAGGVGFTYIYFKKKEKKMSIKAVGQIQANPTKSWMDALKEGKAKEDNEYYNKPEIEEPPIKKLPQNEVIEELPEEEIKEDIKIEETSNEDKVNDLINKFQTELNTLKSESIDQLNKEGESLKDIKEEIKSPTPSPKSPKKGRPKKG